MMYINICVWSRPSEGRKEADTMTRAYKAIANQTAKNNYRADLRETAVQRVSAIRRSQLPVKPEPEQKLRGKKAKKAAEASA